MIVFIISINGIYGIHYTTADDVMSEVYQDIFTFAESTEKGVRITYFLNSFLFTYIFFIIDCAKLKSISLLGFHNLFL